ncbi:MAG TPA: phenylalanine--tRNA ligase subunit alpha, partial [Candidatus Polarisedimenticolia bacterium]|nr:phenylalanine--tRNA ligase subunit alpha [Candidatus Polarisedimenticolia bacterium]
MRTIREQFDREIAGIGDAAALAAVRVRFLGRKEGLLTLLLRDLRDLGGPERAAAG